MYVKTAVSICVFRPYCPAHIFRVFVPFVLWLLHVYTNSNWAKQ